MNLPNSKILPIKHLSSIFKDTTNSYKFYWFIAILEEIKNKTEIKIPSSILIARMISNIWYPINFFRISFGK